MAFTVAVDRTALIGRSAHRGNCSAINRRTRVASICTSSACILCAPILSATVDRHDVVLVGERLAVPAVPALLQAQPGDLGHEVELGRPCVSLDYRIQLHARAR